MTIILDPPGNFQHLLHRLRACVCIRARLGRRHDAMRGVRRRVRGSGRREHRGRARGGVLLLKAHNKGGWPVFPGEMQNNELCSGS